MSGRVAGMLTPYQQSQTKGLAFCTFGLLTKLFHLKHILPDFLFSSIPPSLPNKNITFWSCPLWTPSLTLPPSSLKCWQKSNPNIHRQCFRCFKCFGCFRCFISLLDHKTARFWSKSEQSPQTGTHPPPPYNGCGKHPKRQFTHWSTNTILSCVL